MADTPKELSIRTILAMFAAGSIDSDEAELHIGRNFEERHDAHQPDQVREGAIVLEGELLFSSTDEGPEFFIRGEGVGEAFNRFDHDGWDIVAHGAGGSLFSFTPPVRITIEPLDGGAE